MKRYQVTLIGQTPLLLNQDNIDWGDSMKTWASDPANKPISIAGDDRSPAWRWLGTAYTDKADGTGVFCVSSDNLMTMMREGGAKCPTGKGKATFKAITQSGIIVEEPEWPIVVDGNTVPFAPFVAMVGNNNFEAHESLAKEHGFMLFKKRARMGRAKHLRVRPRFDQWSLSGTIMVVDDRITTPILSTILTHAGAYCGIGDWRPSSPSSPGRFGKFLATAKEVKK